MLTLRSSPASPFGRKVKIAASLLGLTDRIEIVPADTSDPNDSLRQQNPLGKIPILILESGETLYDSRVIMEYLDHLAGGGKIIPAAEARFAALRLQSLGDGIMDAAYLLMAEIRWRTEDRRESKWVEHQQAKVTRSLAHAEAHHATSSQTQDVGTIALACALGYLDLRFEGRWRADHPKLAAWLEAFSAAVPAFEKTRMKT